VTSRVTIVRQEPEELLQRAGDVVWIIRVEAVA